MLLQRPALVWAVAASALLAVPLAFVGETAFGLRLDAATWPRLLLVLVVAPLVEEWVLRTLLQRGLEEALRHRCRPGPAAASVAGSAAMVVFAGMHLDAWTWQALARCGAWLLPGAALATAWCWRRRWTDCALLHAWFNASMWWVGLVAAPSAKVLV